MLRQGNSKPFGVPADWEFQVDSIWINMKVPSTGGKGGAPPPGVAKTQAPGGPQSSLKILFRTNRVWQRGWTWSRDLGTLKNTVFRPFWVLEKVQKNFTLFKNSVFSAVSSLGTHPIFFSMSKTHPRMPWSIPRIIWKLSFERFFSPAKNSL